MRALDGLNLSVAAGSVFALLGPNGVGKSTAVKILTTVSRADSGTAQVAGHDVRLSPGKVRREVGLVSQKSSSDPMSTARENLILAARIQGMARALVHRPRVLFLDEPTTGLDPEARAEMWAEIERLCSDEQVTVLLTTHYLEEADRLAERLAIVDGGRVVVEGTPEQLKSELRRDTVQVELAEPASLALARARLDRIDMLRDVVGDGARLRARADSGARALPAVLGALDDAAIEVASVTVGRPSLDDVYLRHVGRAYRADAARDAGEEVAA